LVDIITREGERVRKLLDDLFNFTEERKYKFSQTTIKTLLLDISAISKQKHLQLEFNITGNVSSVECDEDRIKETFWNIILNSSEAMNNSGTITIDISEQNDNCIILFSDEGGGIPKEYMQKIFDPFFSTKKRGTGIGLALVYRTIRAHHGKISAHNTEKGTQFEIILPLKRSVT
jgi:signal transduction histidine kinase